MTIEIIPTGGLWGTIAGLLNDNFADVDDRLKDFEASGIVFITQANAVTIFGAPLDSTIAYFVTEHVNLSGLGVQIVPPATGLYLFGNNFDLSQLTSSDAAYTMFASGASGSVYMDSIGIEVSGVGSKVYDLTGNTGNEAFELSMVNYNNCTSLGTVAGFRQGLETGTGRFGGTPELTLAGTWSGGFFIDTSIVRGLTAGSFSLFRAGAAFSMASRFRSNQNIDLPAGASFFDFSPVNFPKASTVQMDGCLVTRDGVSDASDPLLTPNMLPSDLPARWKDNVGLSNTFIGGRVRTTVEIETTINTVDTYEVLAGTFVASDLQHFDSPANGQLRFIGDSPREYEIAINIPLDGSAGDLTTIQVEQWDNSAAGFFEVGSLMREINSFAGGRNIAFYNIQGLALMDTNDFLRMRVKNLSGDDNVTAELDSYMIVKERG